LEIVFIALARSFIVLSFLNMLKLNEAHAREKHIIEQNEHMLMLVSNLYEETVYLKKTLNDAEEATRESYQLYRSFKQTDSRASQQALKLAGKIHEIKKDNQRIFAGLSNVIINESPKDFMSVQELVQLTVRINEKYAASLKKTITFSLAVSGDHPPYHVYTFLSLTNNLVSNAVEAIEEAGSVRIELTRSRGLIELHVFNSGLPIPEKYKHIIFDPGFTTKYDKQGNPSTGIGLAHVKELVTSLNGDITLVNEPNGVLFVIKLPMHRLIQKG
ncbi:sensor histidine kinase, partial [Domibacillus tundrae]|uniref:sensor histidine kinase n=1 Tax=Domibacillus tundrae TaxID=1587527 RepID=UPI0033920EC2